MAAGGLYAASGGAAIVASINLLGRSSTVPAYRFGGAFFIFLAAQCMCNMLIAQVPDLPAWIIELSGVLLATIVPLLWIYIYDLTSDRPHRMRYSDARHFVSSFLIFAYAVVNYIVVGDATHAALVAVDTWMLWLGLAVKLVFLVQMTLILARCIFRLFHLRARLRNVFSSTDERELTWLRGLCLLLTVLWLLNIVDNLGLITPPDIVVAIGTLVFSVAMAHWSMRQRPVFELDDQDTGRHAELGFAETDGRSEDANTKDPPVGTDAGTKYGRSLLSDDRLERIEQKIEEIFRREKLHLDANLSLRKLSQGTGVTESHLSQTFSRRMKCTFFDYVNRWRVAEAKECLRNSDDSIATITYSAGFNSRSAFYNAFKLEAGTTPAAFRQKVRAAGG